jgi:putative phosphoesterase
VSGADAGLGYRVAIFSDIHGNIRALDACLADLREQGWADEIVGAGDFCMDGPRPREVLERLEELGARCVRGNTDRYIGDLAEVTGDEAEFAAVAWQREMLGEALVRRLFELPFSLTVGDGEDALLVVHANPARDDEHVWPDASDEQLERVLRGVRERTIAFGHLHLPYVRVWRERTLVDVASCGLPKDGDARASYAILTRRAGGWQVKHRRVEFDVDKVVRDIEKSGMPEKKRRIAVLRRHRYKELGERIP